AISGVYLTEAFQLRNTTNAVREQIARLEETYRRENAKFHPLKADSHEMKVVVDTGDFILRNSVPVSFVMQQLGLVLGDFPDMHVDELTWHTGLVSEDADAERRQRRGEAQLPLPIPQVAEISADVTGQISPFDGDLKQAFERIRRLASELQARTRFGRVQATEFPINDSPAVPLSADIERNGDQSPARFRLRLTMELNGG
ncbi:MAG: hypothetical protein KJO31_00645, partial [Gammaproteobacteria bacterium]|nr:hypothetical protein [Gammaproteobacteria bacterium]